MAKDIISGVILQGNILEWTTLQKAKAPPQRVGFRCAEIAAEPAEAGGAGGGLSAPQLKAECAGVKGPASIGLATDQVLFHVASLPTTDDSELGSMVQLQVDKLSPFPLESLVISYEVIARRADSRLVLCAAAREEVVDALGRTLRAAGVRPARVDAAALSWWRLLSDAGEIRVRGRQLAVFLHRGVSEIIAFQDGLPLLFRSLGGLEGLTEGNGAEEIAHEVRFTLMSLELEHGALPGCGISVWYPEEHEPAKLIGVLRMEHGHEVTAKPLSALPPVSEGLARRMADGEGVDLTPAAWKALQQKQEYRKRMVLAAVLLLAAWLVSVAGLMGGLSYQNLRLARLRAEARDLQGPALEVREMRRRVAMIKRYTDRTHSAIECLRELCEQMPDGIDLSSFTYRKGEWIKISGVGEAVNQIYDFKQNLDASPLFRRGATLKGVQEVPGGRQRFDMELRLPGGSV